ncbi:hypothetical protein A0256_09495 [Mucilaginibacter sp. PAMC 26640]|nr:hypothetical protein A0256_09495 [Mucilaginibacter sp. PAMC 26640]
MGLITPNIIVSNPIPRQTIIYYSKDDAVVKLTGTLIFLCIGINFLCTDFTLAGAPIAICAIYQFYLKSRILLDSRPQIIISLKGIQTASAAFCKWDQVLESKVSGNFEGRGARPCLEYRYHNVKVKLRVDHLNITPQNLHTLLAYYQQPWVFRSNC